MSKREARKFNFEIDISIEENFNELKQYFSMDYILTYVRRKPNNK